MPKAEIVIFKVHAARRQLDAAVRMYFSGEDELATHTVAAAAYRIVRDLRKKRREPEKPREAFFEGVFFVARTYAEGKAHLLPQAIRTLTENDLKIQEFAAWLREQSNLAGRGLDLGDITIETLSVSERAYWTKKAEAANFLKHADVDPQASLKLSKLKTEELIAEAISSYFNLTRQVTAEMRVFMLQQYCDLFDSGSHHSANDSRIVEGLRKIKPELRGQECLQLIYTLKQV